MLGPKMNSHTPPPAFDWRDFIPLAKAETTKFYRKQERGRFRYEELLSVATEALGTSLGANYARKAISGALLDFARDDHKLVRNVEMSEEEFLRTRGSPVPKQPAVRRVCVSRGVRYTLYTPGPYRTNHELLAGEGKVSSKHGKVSVAIGRATYNDEWNQTIGGWKRAKIEDPEEQGHAPAVRRAQPRGDVDQADYIGHGRQQRFSTTCHNKGVDYKSGLGSTDWRLCDGEVEVCGKDPRMPAKPFNRTVDSPLAIALRFMAKPARDRTVSECLRVLELLGDKVDGTAGTMPIVSRKSPARGWAFDEALKQERPQERGPSWHREVRSSRVSWGLPTADAALSREIVGRDEVIEGVSKKIFRLENRREWTGRSLLYLFLNNPRRIWGDVMSVEGLEQGSPSPPALGSALPLVVLGQAEPPFFLPTKGEGAHTPAGAIIRITG
jgi:hypothetical protein